MSILIPFIAALSSAVGVILNKIVLSSQKVGHRPFVIFLFFSLFAMSGLLYPFGGKIEARAFSSPYLLLLLLVILIATVYNIIFYHALEKEKVLEWELIVMLAPLATILLASVFLRVERNLGVFLAGLVASAALIGSHLKRLHLQFDNFQRKLLFYLILYPAEAILIKELLFLYSPVALYMVRTLGVAVALSIWYYLLAPVFCNEPKPSFKKWTKKNLLWCLAISALAVLQMVLTYYGYWHFGIVFTTIVLTLGPILTYIATVLILKERLKKRIILAAVVILACIIYAHFAMT